MVELLGPEHAGERLPHHVGCVGIEVRGNHARVEFIGFLPPRCKDGVKALPERFGRRRCAEAQSNRNRGAGFHGQGIVGRDLGARVLGVDGLLDAVDDVVVNPVLDVRRPVRHANQPLGVRLVLGEKQRGRAVGIEEALAELRVRHRDGPGRGLAK